MSAGDPSTGRRNASGRTQRRGWFQRLGRGTQLTAILLVAVFLAGLVLIADGLLLKAEGQRSGIGEAPAQFADHSSVAGMEPSVRSR
jgi:hypothetical protein